VEDSHSVSPSGQDHQIVTRARALVRRQLIALDLAQLADDAELIVSELVTNAVLHGGGCEHVEVFAVDGGVRIAVADRSAVPPVLGLASIEGMTGRGLRLVARLATRWGVEARVTGKIVWAEVTGRPPHDDALDETDLLDLSDRRLWRSERKPFHVVLGEVPTDLLLAAKSHVDNLVREFALASSGARTGLTTEVVPHLESLVETIARRFSDARESIKRQALVAASTGAVHTRLELDLDLDTANAGEEYLEALDAVDAYCRAARLLTLETPPQHRVFRRWYVEELIVQVRAMAAGVEPRPSQSFEARLLQEIEHVAVARRIAERSARLYTVAGALARAATPEAVADAVLEQGVAALGASGAGLLLASDADRLLVPGTIGYDDEVIARLRAESRDAELPAAVALRTGEAVWIETRGERDSRFPELANLEPATVSVCAVALEVQGRRLGALRFSFNDPRLFDEDERRFVFTLAAQAAQALDRAQVQQSRIDASTRLQRSLLPPSIAIIPGIDAAAVYHPLGDGIEVGGDFYDLWKIDDGVYGIAIGDVVGTGPEAAALTAQVRYSLRALTVGGTDVSATLLALNHTMLTAAADPDNSEIFCTAIFGTVRPNGRQVEVVLSSGGHPFPFVRRADGQLEEVVLGGTLLGPLPVIDVATALINLGPGDRLVLFTDGVVEARRDDGQMFDLDGIRRILAEGGGSARCTVESLEAAVLAHVGGVLADDLAALALRVVPLTESNREGRVIWP
jgi:serine phosphatase RsbU (regulator of sigma subunit)/anti-sigma regulatory factor (Ser/Thr protein kinase)